MEYLWEIIIRLAVNSIVLNGEKYLLQELETCPIDVNTGSFNEFLSSLYIANPFLIAISVPAKRSKQRVKEQKNIWIIENCFLHLS